MKIVHVNLCSFYIDNYKYQENLLPKVHKDMGHEVEIIASTLVFKDNMILSHIKPSTYINEYGIEVTRIPYKRVINQFITDKVRYGKDLIKLLEEKKPDIIFVHGFQTKSIDDIAKYKKKNNNVKIFVDTHTDYYTSGTNWLSRKVLHGLYYRALIKRNIKYISKVYYISISCGDFLREVYKLNEEKLEFLPLGSILHKESEIQKNKEDLRKKHKLSKEIIVFMQAGKIDSSKKLIESLKRFTKVKNNRFRYFIVGSINSEVMDELSYYLKKDKRIISVGWKSASELTRYIDFCDVFVQPGKVSAIMQDAISAYKPVIIKYFKDYVPFVDKNGWMFKDFNELESIYREIDDNDKMLEIMAYESKKVATSLLDYYKIGAKIFD